LKKNKDSREVRKETRPEWKETCGIRSRPHSLKRGSQWGGFAGRKAGQLHRQKETPALERTQRKPKEKRGLDWYGLSQRENPRKRALKLHLAGRKSYPSHWGEKERLLGKHLNEEKVRENWGKWTHRGGPRRNLSRMGPRHRLPLDNITGEKSELSGTAQAPSAGGVLPD